MMPSFVLQVHYLLKDIDLRFIKECVSGMDSFFLHCLPLTPNNHRLMERPHAMSNGQTVTFVISYYFYF